MKNRHSKMVLAVWLAGPLVAGSGTEGTDYYATSDPGQTEPGNWPWIQTTGEVIFDAGSTIWFATNNVYVSANRKSYTLALTGLRVDLLHRDGAWGYYRIGEETYTSLIVSNTTDQYSSDPPPRTMRSKCVFKPQHRVHPGG